MLPALGLPASFLTLVLGFSFIGVRGFAMPCFELSAKTSSSRSPAIEKKIRAQASENLMDVDLDSVVQACAQFIYKSKRSPTDLELAQTAKLDLDDLRTFLIQRNGRKSKAQKKDQVISEQIQELVAVVKQKYPENFVAFEKIAAKKAFDFIHKHKRVPEVAEIAALLDVSEADLNHIYGASKGLVNRISEHHPSGQKVLQNWLVDAFLASVKQHNRTPSIAEYAHALNISEAELMRLVGTGGLFEKVSDVLLAAFKKRPKSFKNFRDPNRFNQKYFDEVIQRIKEADSVIVTSAMGGAFNELGMIEIPVVDADFMKTLQSLSKRNNNAPILVMPVNRETFFLDPALYNTPNVYVIPESWGFDKFLTLNGTGVRPNQINPLQSLDRMGKRGERQIVASPKSMVITKATYDNHFQSHVMYTTGVVTMSHYAARNPEQYRLKGIAGPDHFMGALVLEKSLGGGQFLNAPMSGFFHIRRLVYIPEKQGFMFMNKFYKSDGSVEPMKVEAIGFGDSHIGETDPEILNSKIAQIKYFKPNYVIIHDGFNGKSVSSHDEKDQLLMIRKAEKGETDVLAELNANKVFYQAILNADPKVKIVIPLANHNSWLHRWIRNPDYRGNDLNAKVHLALRNAVVNLGAKDPYGWWLSQNMGKEFLDRIVFLEPGQSFKRGPEHRSIELGIHGDKGDGPSRPSPRTFQVATDGIAFGHTHTFWVHNHHVNIGTTTPQTLGYTEGQLSRWIRIMDIIGENGEQVPFEFRYGEWYRQSRLTAQQRKDFFREGYPNMKQEDPSAFIVLDPRNENSVNLFQSEPE